MFPLSGEEREALQAAFTRTAQFPADVDIVSDGDRPSDCNLLLEGLVCRYKLLADGKRQILAFQFPGDIFDAQSFILQKLDHSIGTLTPCRVAVLPHATMLAITERYPRIGRAIWKDTLVDAAVFREWMTSIGRRTAHARIAHLMCEVFLRLRAVSLADGYAIPWPMTQAEIGDAMGLSLVHVNRTIQELRSAGLITLRDQRLTILDWEGLKAAGDFDLAYLHMDLPESPGSAGENSRPVPRQTLQAGQ